MFAVFLTPDYVAFSIAFVVMIGIGLIETVGLGLGHFDLHPDFDAEGEGAGVGDLGVLDWLGLKRGLPILVWLTSLLGCFTVAGVSVQQIATGMTGSPLHGAVASAIALVVGVGANKFAAGGLARLLPEYESTVIDTEDLLMRRGVVLDGSASRGRPSRAKIVDQHGQAHYAMIEPHHDGDVIEQGDIVLLVRRQGGLFFVEPDNSPFRPI